MHIRTAKETKIAMLESGENWRIPFMEFVDDFRRTRDPVLVQKAFRLDNERMSALLSSTIEYLCDEMEMEPPDWVWEVPSCKEPWFISGLESLKAITLVESPAHFRRRKIFVLGNFLSRA